MTAQELEFASGALILAMVILVAYLLIWWPELSIKRRAFWGSGAFVMLVIWALL